MTSRRAVTATSPVSPAPLPCTELKVLKDIQESPLQPYRELGLRVTLSR